MSGLTRYESKEIDGCGGQVYYLASAADAALADKDAEIERLTKDRKRLIASNEHWHERVGSFLPERESLLIENAELHDRVATKDAGLDVIRRCLDGITAILDGTAADPERLVASIFADVRAALGDEG